MPLIITHIIDTPSMHSTALHFMVIGSELSYASWWIFLVMLWVLTMHYYHATLLLLSSMPRPVVPSRCMQPNSAWQVWLGKSYTQCCHENREDKILLAQKCLFSPFVSPTRSTYWYAWMLWEFAWLFPFNRTNIVKPMLVKLFQILKFIVWVVWAAIFCVKRWRDRGYMEGKVDNVLKRCQDNWL